MWSVITENGMLTERQIAWPNLDPEIGIIELRYTCGRGKVGSLSGFDAYGFQRFSVSAVDGSITIPHAGTQIIGVKGETAVVVEINELSGEITQEEKPMADVTYSRRLLRNGA